MAVDKLVVFKRLLHPRSIHLATRVAAFVATYQRTLEAIQAPVEDFFLMWGAAYKLYFPLALLGHVRPLDPLLMTMRIVLAQIFFALFLHLW